MDNPVLVVQLSTISEDLKVFLIGNEEKSRINLLRSFERCVEPKLLDIKGNFKLVLAITGGGKYGTTNFDLTG